MCFKRAIKTYVRKSHRRLDASKNSVRSPALLRAEEEPQALCHTPRSRQGPVARRPVS